MGLPVSLAGEGRSLATVGEGVTSSAVMAGGKVLVILRHGLDLGYRLSAKNRLRLTGRCTTETCETP
ncbi:hypothetical protein Poly41_49060 [Novipirellula artificiosorum]|uniref:Uncharacterized protein n=1 Tax=Novipirellula artificiosorum TaxID=2528016 RepID=A0A5C6DFK2_9BACT|nr:hypothetical protein Poly41_49060 [Novipirellula artificiosorum]